MRVSRMLFRLDIGGVVVQQIEHVMALVLVRPNDLRIDRDVVRDQRVGAHALFQAKIFRRVPRIDRLNLRFHALTVAAGMHAVPDIVEVERRESRDRVADDVVDRVEGFQPQIIARRGHQRRVAETRDVRHVP